MMLKKIFCLIILINFIYFEASALPAENEEEYSDEVSDVQRLFEDEDYEDADSISDEDSYDQDILDHEQHSEKATDLLSEYQK
ncbi:hypothetical protein ILUMI_10323 [Ignelater luminosus]|uniref:Uncharacterized protein n=1 Tax=Ignelater luminosus TaxID=2038154 RepID=A0A8K0D446_IGNLU|nr:hypothetical protein ILUMI_10323 [Ignelater luminosus]